jgi:hypothetical protein
MDRMQKERDSATDKNKTVPTGKNKATSGGSKDTNEGGRPSNEKKVGKGNTTGSRGTQK